MVVEYGDDECGDDDERGDDDAGFSLYHLFLFYLEHLNLSLLSMLLFVTVDSQRPMATYLFLHFRHYLPSFGLT